MFPVVSMISIFLLKNKNTMCRKPLKPTWRFSVGISIKKVLLFFYNAIYIKISVIGVFHTTLILY